MKRRNFVTLLGGAALTWPLSARGQQPAVPTIGFLAAASFHEHAPYATSFSRGLAETGFVDGKTVAIDYRWAEGRYEQLPALAGTLVQNHVALIMASGGLVSARAAMAATTSTPIVFVTADDPVRAGLVASLGRPGGNVTGVTIISNSLGAKRLDLLRDLVPKDAVRAVLVNPNNPSAAAEGRELEAAASASGQRLLVLNASSVRDFETAFVTIAQRRAGALLVAADAFYLSERERLAALAARERIPAIYFEREFVVAGGLVSYGTSLSDAYHQAGLYVGKILNGAKPADLPVFQVSKFELVVNLKTAKALDLTMPPSLLIGADEVIE
jgi:ABC-type uncharacterized transport system substrate-binding protein